MMDFFKKETTPLGSDISENQRPLATRPFDLEHATTLARFGVKSFEEENDEFFPISYIWVEENPDEKGGGYKVNILNSYPGKLIGNKGETANKIARYLSNKFGTKVYVDASHRHNPYDPFSEWKLIKVN